MVVKDCPVISRKTWSISAKTYLYLLHLVGDVPGKNRGRSRWLMQSAVQSRIKGRQGMDRKYLCRQKGDGETGK